MWQSSRCPEVPLSPCLHLVCSVTFCPNSWGCRTSETLGFLHDSFSSRPVSCRPLPAFPDCFSFPCTSYLAPCLLPLPYFLGAVSSPSRYRAPHWWGWTPSQGSPERWKSRVSQITLPAYFWRTLPLQKRGSHRWPTGWRAALSVWHLIPILEVTRELTIWGLSIPFTAPHIPWPPLPLEPGLASLSWAGLVSRCPLLLYVLQHRFLRERSQLEIEKEYTLETQYNRFLLKKQHKTKN